MRRVLAALGVVLVGVTAGACGRDGGSPTTVALDDPFAGTAMTVEGGQVDLGAFDDKDLVVWFWAPW